MKADDGLELHVHEWKAQGTPRLSLALLHGYGEHAGRYAHFAEAMNARGISVTGVDLRGHGKSKGARGHVDAFQQFHSDAKLAVNRAKELGGGAPVALFGHSMGALLALDWLLAGNGKELAGVALSSPFLGIALKVNPVKEGLGRVMSRLIPTLSLPSGLKGSDACRDPKLQELYDSDPLNNKNATARWFTEAMKAIDRVHARANEIKGPLILLYGGSDRIASADATDQLAKKLACEDKTVERLEGHYHELVNEGPEDREKIFDRYATWLLARVGNKT
jgi:alpha-beta hydrolase superfamily lysophospholipase